METKNEIINGLWNKFYSNYDDIFKSGIISKIQNILEQWRLYHEIIENNNFQLIHYTDRINNSNLTMPGGYLCNFLETTTRNIFGSSKPGTAVNYEIKCNDDGNSYYIRGSKKDNANLTEANDKFNSLIKPLLENIINGKNIEEKIHIIDDANYSARQALMKIGVLENPKEFVYIYSEKVINDLYDEFVNKDHEGRLEKNHQIKIAVSNILKLAEPDEYSLYLLTSFLWNYSQSKAIADEESPNVILYGSPGTGKTYSVRKSLEFVCRGNKKLYEIIQFHPSFAYEDFIEGIKPKGVSKDGNLKFELVNGVFKRFCMKAKKDPDNNYYFVVDEINRANLSSVFGETLSTLEKDYRHNIKNDKSSKNLIKTQYSTLIEEMIKDGASTDLAYEFIDDQVYFGVPINVFFIGMMNDVDKSIDTFDLALRRRFKWERKDCDYDVIEEETKFKGKEDFTNIENYRRSCENLNKYISVELGLGKSYEFGHSFFMRMSSIAKRKEISSKNLENLFNVYLKPTLKEYLRAVFAESELDDKIYEALEKFKQNIKK